MDLTQSITPNFKYEEFIVSETRPDLVPYCKDLFRERERLNAKQLVESTIQPIRDEFMWPMSILSGFRPPILNQAIGGALDSDHISLMAADFTCRDLIGVFYWAYHTNIPYRQMIYYPDQNFIHMSINAPDKDYRHEAMVKWDSNKDYKDFNGSKIVK